MSNYLMYSDRTQRGFALPSPLLILGVVAGVLALAAVVLFNRLGVEQEAHAKTKASLTLWKDSATACSTATEKAAKEAADRQKRAEIALGAARKGAVSARAEVDRLRAAKPSGGACPAGDAVAAVRKGLK